MKRSRRPPYLHLVCAENIENDTVASGSPYPLLDSIEIATAPLADAARFMAAEAVRVVAEAAEDFGFSPGDVDPLREKVRVAVVDFSIGWIAERLAEYRRRTEDGSDAPG